MATTYLTRSKSSPTSDKKGTISFWFKRSKITAEQVIIVSGSGSIDSNIYLNGSTDKLHVYDYQSGAFSFQYITTRVFRDASAWYAITVEIDTTLSTAADRVKIYINGVRETAFDTSTAPSQNATPLFFTSANPFYIGAYRGSSSYFDGLLSHFHYTDGYAYGASTFGSTDTNGQWKINTSPSITMGTNGFTILKDGNTITDQSANSNDFTLGGGTLTNTEDCPSNVFATINTLQGAIASGYTVANGNLGITANTGSAWRSLPATLAVSSGKFYWEVKITGFSTGMHFGVQDVEQAPQSNAYAYQYSRAYMYKDDGGIANNGNVASYGNSWTTNDIVGVALDMDNLKIYFSKNGTFQNSGVPTSGSTGTGAAYTLASGYTYTPMFSTNASADTFQYNFGNGFFGTSAISSEGTNASGIGKFEYDVPTGYTALSTKGLNL